MRRTLLAALASVGLVLGTLAGATTASATHYLATITWPLNSSGITNECHGGPFYFDPVFGWVRTCAGAKDIGNAGSDKNVYIRGTGWSNSTITAKYNNPVYYNQTCTAPAAGLEYGNAWEVYLSDGTAGVAFHHMSNHHYNPGAVVANGTNVGDQADWGARVYYCSGALAADGPHIHMEAARAGALVDEWRTTDVKFTHAGCPCFLESAAGDGH